VDFHLLLAGFIFGTLQHFLTEVDSGYFGISWVVGKVLAGAAPTSRM